MAPPTKVSFAALQKELSEVIGQMQVLEERQRVADGLEERLKLAEARISALLRQDINAMNQYASEITGVR